MRCPKYGTFLHIPVTTWTKIVGRDPRNQRSPDQLPRNRRPLRSNLQHPLSSLCRRRWREGESDLIELLKKRGKKEKKEQKIIRIHQTNCLVYLLLVSMEFVNLKLWMLFTRQLYIMLLSRLRFTQSWLRCVRVNSPVEQAASGRVNRLGNPSVISTPTRAHPSRPLARDIPLFLRRFFWMGGWKGWRGRCPRQKRRWTWRPSRFNTTSRSWSRYPSWSTERIKSIFLFTFWPQ